MQQENGKVERLAFSVAEAAESIGCSPGHIRNLIERKELRSAKIGRRRVVSVDDLRSFLAERMGAHSEEARA